MINPKEYISRLNRNRKKKYPSPYISRKKYLHLKSKYDALANAITSTRNPFIQPALIKSPRPFVKKSNQQELCLFVSYAATPCVKPHVEHHIKAMLKEGIDVILIINTDDIEVELKIPESIKKLSGIYIRENIGFDFGAWSQIYAELDQHINVDRLYLANDSIIGPLSESFFEKMISKIRSSNADMIGLTSNQEPSFHLQSFFLVLGRRILEDTPFSAFLKSLWQLPTKEMVIDFYETRLTRLLLNSGYNIETIYPTDDLILDKANAVVYSLQSLLERGFPYIKTSMANKPDGKEILNKFMPLEILNSIKNT